MERPRWLRNTLDVWLGYLLTAIAAIPASILGLWLLGKGVGQQISLLISVFLAVLCGFLAEQVLRSRLLTAERHVVPPSPQISYQVYGGKSVTAASFVLVVSGVTTGPTVETLPRNRETTASSIVLTMDS